MKNLVGSVVRLHSKTQPERFKLYMVTDGEYGSYSSGHIRQQTVKS